MWDDCAWIVSKLESVLKTNSAGVWITQEIFIERKSLLLKDPVTEFLLLAKPTHFVTWPSL